MADENVRLILQRYNFLFVSAKKVLLKIYISTLFSLLLFHSSALCVVFFRHADLTNIAYLAATVANIGVEYGFGKHCSVDLPIIYSPYTVARDYRLRFLAVQPEFRYWLKEPMKGHFFGAHLNIGAFNIAVDDKNRYQSPDGFYGAGLSYGYVLPFARHWAAEFTIGAGYVHTKYDTYYNIPNGTRFEKGIAYNYWGLTKVGIGLVYRFGK